MIFKFIHYRKSKCALILAAQTKSNESRINKIESQHGMIRKNLQPININSAPSKSKSKATLNWKITTVLILCKGQEKLVIL